MSKIALISDIHANLPALNATIESLEKLNPDIWICLGDIVGYGPNPSECIDRVREKDMVCVLGNHDAGVVGKLSVKHFRNPNRKLIELTKSLLSVDQMNWLSSIPLTYYQENAWLAAHASPVNPEKWEYLESAFKIRPILKEIEAPFIFVGHTHKSAIVSNSFGTKHIEKDKSYLINPGSVGQSRDGDYRASCAFLDTENLEFRIIRSEFNIDEVLTDLQRLKFTRKEAEHMMLT